MRKILVVNLTRFGDLLQTSPTIVGLREQHPGAEIVVLVERNFADVARGLPGVDRVWELDLDGLGRLLLGQTGDGLREAYRLVDDTVRALRAERFDLALNYSSSKMSAVLLKLVGAPDTRGWTVEPGYQLLLFDHLQSAKFVPVFRFMRSLERRGTFPDLYGYWPPASDNLAVRTISRKGRAQNGSGILRDHMPNTARKGGEDMVRPAWRHAEPGRNDLAPPGREAGGR